MATSQDSSPGENDEVAVICACSGHDLLSRVAHGHMYPRRLGDGPVPEAGGELSAPRLPLVIRLVEVPRDSECLGFNSHAIGSREDMEHVDDGVLSRDQGSSRVERLLGLGASVQGQQEPRQGSVLRNEINPGLLADEHERTATAA